ncbi:hypothetical protein ACTMU2_24610 [Cupriavidus basilensis]
MDGKGFGDVHGLIPAHALGLLALFALAAVMLFWLIPLLLAILRPLVGRLDARRAAGVAALSKRAADGGRRSSAASDGDVAHAGARCGRTAARRGCRRDPAGLRRRTALARRRGCRRAGIGHAGPCGIRPTARLAARLARRGHDRRYRAWRRTGLGRGGRRRVCVARMAGCVGGRRVLGHCPARRARLRGRAQVRPAAPSPGKHLTADWSPTRSRAAMPPAAW